MINKKYVKIGNSPSAIRDLFNYGLEQAKIVGPENVYDYSLGNPSIPAPAKVNETIKWLVDNVDPIKVHGYSAARGNDSFREAIANNLNKRFNLGANPDKICVTCGCIAALTATVMAITDGPDDEIVTIAPFFPAYYGVMGIPRCKLTIVPADFENFQINFEALEERINEHTRGVIINSPNNPSGVVYTEDTIRKIAALLEKKSAEYGYPIYIIADEPYRELVYGDAKAVCIPNIYDNTVVCYSWSKSLSLPGERIGYVCVPDKCENGDDLYWAVVGASSEIGSVCPPSLIQRVVEACIDEMPDLTAYDANRTLLYNSLTEIGYEMAKPDGAFYMLVKCPNGDAKAFSNRAKLEHNLLVVPTDSFGCPGYMRLSYCVSYDTIKNSIPAFKEMYEYYTK